MDSFSKSFVTYYVTPRWEGSPYISVVNTYLDLTLARYEIESPRVHRRPVCLSQATLPDSFKLS